MLKPSSFVALRDKKSRVSKTSSLIILDDLKMARFLKHYIQRRSTVKGQYYILKSKLKAFKKPSFFIFWCRLEDPTEVVHVLPNGQKLVNFECKKIWFSSHYTLYSRRKIKEWKKIYLMFYLCNTFGILRSWAMKNSLN